MKRVVITGLGALTAIGNNVKEYWKELINGKSGANLITKFDAQKHKTKFACEIKNLNTEKFFEKGEARKYDLFTQYALIAVEEALADSGLLNGTINREKIGVIWASGNGGVTTFDEQLLEYAKGDGTPRFNPYFIPRILVDMASGIISIKHQLHGINYTAVSACASSNTAMMDAFNYIRWGKADAIITGGSEAPITPSVIGGFNACKALSTNNNEYLTASRPFDKSRDGFVIGEGAAALIFEEYEHAIKRGAKIYAEVAGAGMSADAYHLTATHPDGKGALLSMQNALEDAQIAPSQINYINMHATSTPVGDISEVKALLSLFKNNLVEINLSATKSQIGHLLGAAGAAEAVATILALKNNVIPPTINTKNLDDNIPVQLNFTLGEAQERRINYALSNNFGFGGHNATIIFKKFMV
jgi:3-oxoacyl-[acyl-carrier-protein] synthase II